MSELNTYKAEIELFEKIESLIENKNKMIYDLYRLLDDIDTGSDLYKDNTEGYLKYIRNLHGMRFDVVNEVESDRLYDLYYKGELTKDE